LFADTGHLGLGLFNGSLLGHRRRVFNIPLEGEDLLRLQKIPTQTLRSPIGDRLLTGRLEAERRECSCRIAGVKRLAAA
jgi:hypothetical protein